MVSDSSTALRRRTRPARALVQPPAHRWSSLSRPPRGTGARAPGVAGLGRCVSFVRMWVLQHTHLYVRHTFGPEWTAPPSRAAGRAHARWSSSRPLVELTPAGRACRDHPPMSSGLDSGARCARARSTSGVSFAVERCLRWSSSRPLVELTPAGRACRDHPPMSSGLDSGARCARARSTSGVSFAVERCLRWSSLSRPPARRSSAAFAGRACRDHLPAGRAPLSLVELVETTHTNRTLATQMVSAHGQFGEH